MTAELSALIAKLFLVIHQAAGYAVPASPPAVSFLPPAAIAEQACGRPCAVRAFYSAARGVVLDETLDVVGNPKDRAVLLHELVHYLQDLEPRFDELSACERFFAREREAYRLQIQYMVRAAGADGELTGVPIWPVSRC